MNRSEKPSSYKHAAGFTLVVVLVVAAALLIAAVSSLAVSGIERGTSRATVDQQRAELAAHAGLEELRGIITREASNDEFLIVQSTLNDPINPEREATPHLFLARGKVSGENFNFRYIPLFSTNTLPEAAPLAAPEIESLITTDEHQRIDFTTLPYLGKARAAWVYLKDDQNRSVARYAYWVEDLQGKIDASAAVNDDGPEQSHQRAAWPFPAPGLNPQALSDDQAPLNQIALYAVDPNSSEDAQGEIAKSILKNRAILITPDSCLAAADIPPPIQRGADGHQIDTAARAVEENLSAVVCSYEEQPTIPFGKGIDALAAGSPKLNLNQLLTKDAATAIEEMAAHIKRSLPEFDQRKGGFPDDYLRTLAANAIDYADADSEASISNNRYRGLDACPLVSEFLMRFRWENALTENGRKYLVLSASTYAELWNMCDQAVSGNAEISFETAYKFPLGANPEVSLADLSNATPELTESDDRRWFPPIAVTLKPNEYRVIHFGTVTYKIDAGPSSVFIPSPLVLEGETFGASGAGYRLKWNGKIVDQSRGGVHRNNCSLHFPKDTATQPRQRIRTTIPSHSHTRGGIYCNNMGDPRMAFYNQAPQDANTYPDNYSPNRRNVRWGTIYSKDSANKTKVHGRVMPSEWPDGGHNSSYESNEFFATDERINPDDPRFFPNDDSILRNPEVAEAPMRISNLGRFYSVTELGRIYDPIMWKNSMPTAANMPWGDVEISSESSDDYGGGNTLRIGRADHPRFSSKPGMDAHRLLDLFHAGISTSDDASKREGPTTLIRGHVNINTATRDVLRALVVGAMTMDPKISVRTSEAHNTTQLMAPPVSQLKLTPQEINNHANRIADAILLARKSKPFASPSEIANARGSDGKSVFGNKELLPDGEKIHLSDSASEECFARIHESTTARSRNFRIWIVAQAISPTLTTTHEPEVLAEVRRAYTV
ncbi:MAG: hypothetical protein RLY69_191, partial [Verrucomicrobiota bacterium]